MTATAEYMEIRDRIETVAALATAAVRGVEVLDLDDADSLSDEVKTAAADAVWSGLCAGIQSLDRLDR
ncbi:hypothetical protein [Mycolicibacter virginiensis]|uniref:hypothetical protein n=1 Tax=Mycolicibacter virginiensis TaxID=1795032 RepID=UPI001F03B53D|nr:hypothetical protein [Mycolicibacter virginiensis]ULP45928.1 hypothetical protein MJO54_13715 [Mycolicibacter virginiensis]